MQLLAKRRSRISQGPISADAVVAKIGGSADELVKRYGAVGEDFMGRPLLRFDDAKAAYDAALVADHHRAMQFAQYEGYLDERKARRREIRDRIWAETKDRLPKRLHVAQIKLACDAAVLEAWARFDSDEPELTITEFRAREAKSA